MGLLDGMLGGQGGGQAKPGLGSTVLAGVALALLIKAVKDHGPNATASANAPAGQGGPGQGDQGSGGLGSILGGLGGMLGGTGGQAGGLGGLGGLLAGAGGGQGGGLGGLGGLLSGGGAGGLGGLLGGLGGAGGLGALMGQLQKSGFADHAQSWMGHGPNQAIQPGQVAQALGEDTVAELQQHTGMPREALLTTLSQELPEALNQATPDGRLPSDDELSRMTNSG